MYLLNEEGKLDETLSYLKIWVERSAFKVGWRPQLSLTCLGVSLTILAGGKLVFTGGQNY